MSLTSVTAVITENDDHQILAHARSHDSLNVEVMSNGSRMVLTLDRDVAVSLFDALDTALDECEEMAEARSRRSHPTAAHRFDVV